MRTMGYRDWKLWHYLTVSEKQVRKALSLGAADWNLEKPDWTGRLRVVAKGRDLFIKLEDKTSGELFAQCPVESYPGVAVEAVMDSSRYFVIRLKDEGGRSAFIGIGFEDRGDSFDLNVALQDHFKWLKNEDDAKKATAELSKGPKLDLGFKEGQTIKINIAGVGLFLRRCNTRLSCRDLL
ncbi:hypothetical protein FSP39_017515 [Pinctada imbricata]|uniref:NECAP PHear domain-containing protein n=1 Tax=Pinctada imbricata TaxID=66713 RepID=A0AA89C1N4_PINIB|nr:hypothetical protein FSP39_017515 [Pinctada imbricata]